ncbi:MAG: polysaccharide deacetylase family protein [Arthrobacter sp.]|jgi:peptidoglycan/xylan/chitin deacetylase (PgdA/CDA1 family)|nr:polysaccharide deacetylase family protein [Arthrobacter sp.]
MRPRRPLILTALGLAATLTLGALTGCTASEPSAQGSSTAPNQSSPAGTPATTAPSGGTPSASASPTPAPTTPAAASDFTPTVPAGATTVWPDNSMVPHLFFHSLVVDPKVAFGLKNKAKAAGYLDYMVTVDEFKKVLTQVYKNDYVLVSPHQLGKVNAKGVMVSTPLKVPKGKKPLVLSIDDVSYYEYMTGEGFPTKLVVAEDGSVQNEYTAPGSDVPKIGAYDVMPIVDEFVKEHPDFAPFGHKGVIALTGYNGVLGYRSSPSMYGPGGDADHKNPHLQADIAEATKVANALKASGWEFASHSWGHINFTKSSLGRIQADTARWKKDVEPITGPTDLLIYPFGADISGLPKYSGPKYDYLKKAGYNFYFNVDGSTPQWGQWGKGYLREARINVDGISLKAALEGRQVLSHFFDPKSVLDPLRPASISGTTS